eukprot:GABV01003802.1.p1 GENE.GABV01003802.1~~GABV01003802.1.p1  ORF type:complete len:118 (-),score=20.38 GABV01003802.1:91-444(-)
MRRAFTLFTSQAHGPAVGLYLAALRAEFDAAWRAGRQRCDAQSLTGNPCRFPVHEPPPVHPHASMFEALHACSCGNTRRQRPDPFDLTSANRTFFGCPAVVIVLATECLILMVVVCV